MIGTSNNCGFRELELSIKPKILKDYDQHSYATKRLSFFFISLVSAPEVESLRAHFEVHDLEAYKSSKMPCCGILHDALFLFGDRLKSCGKFAIIKLTKCNISGNSGLKNKRKFAVHYLEKLCAWSWCRAFLY